MWGYCIAAATLDIKHRVLESFQVSPVARPPLGSFDWPNLFFDLVSVCFSLALAVRGRVDWESEFKACMASAAHPGDTGAFGHAVLFVPLHVWRGILDRGAADGVDGESMPMTSPPELA